MRRLVVYDCGAALSAVSCLPDESQARLFRGLLSYAATGTMPELKSTAETVVFMNHKSIIDRDYKSFSQRKSQ